MAKSTQLCKVLIAVSLLTVAPRFAHAQLQLAITIDDLPAHGALPPGQTRLSVAQSILATLKLQKLPPTYGFINADKTEEHSEDMAVLKAWRAAGQPLGNHTWSHPDLEKTDPELFEAEIEANQPLLRQLMPHDDWHWFRYPYLHEGETLERQQVIRTWLLSHHYRIAEVSMDFEDYLWNDPYARCLAKNDTAALADLHDTYLSTADQEVNAYRDYAKVSFGHEIPYILLLHIGAFDAHMLPELLDLYRRRGFSFVTLAQASADPAYATDPAFGYQGGGAITEILAAKNKYKFPPNIKPYKRLHDICR